MEKLEFTDYFEEVFSQPLKTTPLSVKNLIERAIEKRIITQNGGRMLYEELF